LPPPGPGDTAAPEGRLAMTGFVSSSNNGVCGSGKIMHNDEEPLDYCGMHNL